MNGNDLIRMGYKQGAHFGKVLPILNQREHTLDEITALMDAHKPPPTIPTQEPAPCTYNITAKNDAERSNLEKVKQTMDVVLRTPVVIQATIMPDACPAGPVGVIPVGGVVATKNAIVPRMHSADICCSLMLTTYNDVSPADLLEGIDSVTHFGPRPREGQSLQLPDELKSRILSNPLTKDLLNVAEKHLGTQGDGNHFAYVGTLESNGMTTLVTHHGSRGFGAALYKKGSAIAEKYRQQLSPATSKHNAWIPADTQHGIDYWDALQIVREWTKANHSILHMLGASSAEANHGAGCDRIWNEHNFVFKEDDIFYHAKGATPVHNPFIPDTNGVQIIPLNMAEPILLVQGERTSNNMGFAPHGAGRNMSRTEHIKSLGDRNPDEVFAEETKHIDARFWCGKNDLSELPSAYKNADSVQADMRKFNLAKVVDRVLPYGSIMAGDWEQDAPWRKKKA